MIFNTTKNLSGKSEIGLNKGIKNLFNGGFFAPTSFNLSEVLPESDIETIKAYNKEYDRLTGIVSKYTDAVPNIKNTTIAQKAANKTLGEASDKVKMLQASANGGKIALDRMTGSSKAAQLGMQLLSTAASMFAMVVATWVVQGLYQIITYSNTLANSASKFGAQLKSTSDDISSYKDRIIELNETIKSSSSSYEEVTQARKDLMTIQNEMIEKYGKEQGAIKLITEAIKGQADALDGLTSIEYNKIIRDFNADTNFWGKVQNFFKGSNFSQMKDVMENGGYTVSFERAANNEELNKEIKKRFGATDLDNGYLELSGNLQDVYDKLVQIQELSKSYDNTDNFFDKIGNSISETEEKLDKYQGMYETYVLQEEILAKDSPYKDYYKQALDAYEDYQKQVTENGLDSDEAKKSAENYASICTDAISEAFKNGDDGVIDFFKNLYPELQSEVNNWNFEAKVTPVIDGKDNSDYQENLDKKMKNALSHFNNAEDILNFDPKASQDKDKKSAYEDLKEIAYENFDSDISALVDAAVHLYGLQTQKQEDLLAQLQKINKKQQERNIKDAKKNLEDESKKIQDWGLGDYAEEIEKGTLQSVFGNVDMDKRVIIHWSDELKQTYKDALASWDYDPEIGTIDTVFGGSERFGENLKDNGWEVAFTPILPDGTFLSKDTVYEYIEKILQQAYADDGKVTEDELKKIDEQGMKIGNTFVHGIFAGVDDSLNYENNGNWAEVVGRLMHFAGETGAEKLGKKEFVSAAQNDTPTIEKDVAKDWMNSLKDEDYDLILDNSAKFNSLLEEQIDNIGDEKISVDELTAALNKLKDAQEDVSEAPSIENTITKVSGLNETFNKLNKIREDIKDKGAFDYSALVDTDFKNAFSNVSDEYEKFIKIVSQSPNDINKCQSAFDGLIGKWLMADGTLGNLSADTLDLTAKMLEGQGVTNASAVVQSAYINQLISEDEKKGGLTQTTIDYISKVAEENGWTDVLALSQGSLQIAYTTCQTAMTTALTASVQARLEALSIELEQIKTVSAAYAALDKINQGFEIGDGTKYVQSDSKDWYIYDAKGGTNSFTKVDAETAAQLTQDKANAKLLLQSRTNLIKAQDKLKDLSIKTTVPTYKGVPSTSRNGGSGGGGGGSSSQDSYWDTWQEQLKDKQNDIQKYIDADEKLNKQYDEAVRTNNTDLANELYDQIISGKDDIRGAYAKAAAEVRKLLNSEILPELFEIAPELKGQAVDEWSEEAIKKIQESFTDENTKSKFSSLVSVAQNMFDYVGSKAGEGSWSDDYLASMSAQDSFSKEHYESIFNKADDAIDKLGEEVDAVDDLIGVYEDEMDTIETLDSLKGKSMENYTDSYVAALNKMQQYGKKEKALQSELIANQTALLEVEKVLKTIDPNDPKSIETYQALTERAKKYKDAVKDVTKAIKDNEKARLDWLNEMHGQIVDKLKDIYSLQQSEAEDALDKQHEAALKALEDEKDAAVKASEEKIKAIEKEIDALDERNDKTDTAKTLQEKYMELAKVYADQSSWIIDNDGNLVKTYDKQKAKELEQEIQDMFTEQSREDEKKKLEDQKQALEDEKDNLEDEYDKRIDALEKAQEKEKDAFDKYWDYILSETNLNNEARRLEEEKGYKASLEALDSYYDSLVASVDTRNKDLIETGHKIATAIGVGLFEDMNTYIDTFVDDLTNRAGYLLDDGKSGNVHGTARQKLIEQMYANSQSWAKTSDEKERTALAELNSALGDELGAQFDKISGTWTIDGQNIYDELSDDTKESIKATVDNTDVTDLLTKATSKSLTVERQIATITGTTNTKLENVVKSNDTLKAAIDKNTEALGNASSGSGNNGNNSTSKDDTKKPDTSTTDDKDYNEYPTTKGDTTTVEARQKGTMNLVGTKVIKNGKVISADGVYADLAPKDNTLSSALTSEQRKVIEQMWENSQAWSKTSDENRKKELAADNQRLGTKAGFSYNDKSGIWSLNGVDIYKLVGKYHTGIAQGLVGKSSLTDEEKFFRDVALDRLKPDEVAAILQDGEAVFTPPQLHSLYETMSGLASIPVALSSVSNLKNSPVPTATPQVVEKGNTFNVATVNVSGVNDLNGFIRQLELHTKPYAKR